MDNEAKLLNDNIGLCRKQAQNFPINNVCNMDDYIQQGAAALLNAIRKIDPTRAKLSTYAWPIIYRDIKKKQSDKFSRPAARYQDYVIYDKEDFWEAVPDNLTDGEIKVIQMKLDGYNTRQIAKLIQIKCKEVELILGAAYAKIKDANI